jgi:hypothetical protein
MQKPLIFKGFLTSGAKASSRKSVKPGAAPTTFSPVMGTLRRQRRHPKLPNERGQRGHLQKVIQHKRQTTDAFQNRAKAPRSTSSGSSPSAAMLVWLLFNFLTLAGSSTAFAIADQIQRASHLGAWFPPLWFFVTPVAICLLLGVTTKRLRPKRR